MAPRIEPLIALIPQPESRRWGCALNAFSVASGLKSPVLEAVVGHDGSETEGWTDSELTRALFMLGYTVTHLCFAGLDEGKRIRLRNIAMLHTYVLYYYINGDLGRLHAVAGMGRELVDCQKGVRFIQDIPVIDIDGMYIVSRETANEGVD